MSRTPSRTIHGYVPNPVFSPPTIRSSAFDSPHTFSFGRSLRFGWLSIDASAIFVGRSDKVCNVGLASIGTTIGNGFSFSAGFVVPDCPDPLSFSCPPFSDSDCNRTQHTFGTGWPSAPSTNPQVDFCRNFTDSRWIGTCVRIANKCGQLSRGMQCPYLPEGFTQAARLECS